MFQLFQLTPCIIVTVHWRVLANFPLTRLMCQSDGCTLYTRVIGKFLYSWGQWMACNRRVLRLFDNYLDGKLPDADWQAITNSTIISARTSAEVFDKWSIIIRRRRRYWKLTSTENCLTPIDRQLPTRQSSQRGAVLSGLGKFHWPDLDLVPGWVGVVTSLICISRTWVFTLLTEYYTVVKVSSYAYDFCTTLTRNEFHAYE